MLRSMDPAEADADEQTTLLSGVLRCPTDDEGGRNTELVAYKSRWYILAVLSILSASNSMMWISFSPIADVAANYYGVGTMSINWLSLVYLIATVPMGFVAICVLDTYGLRTGILLAGWLNAIGAILRVISGLDIPQNERYIFAIMGQSIAACAQAFFMCAPTKIAALWFKDDQRAVANTIGSMSNPLGVMIANLISPAVVKSSSQFPTMLYIYAAPAILGVLMATFGVRSSVPPTPPSSSAAQESEPFFAGLKSIIKVRSYWILAVAAGGGIALFTALSTLLEQMLCTRGYSDFYAGLCGALLIGVGIIGAAFGGIFVDRTKKFEECAKFSYACAALSGIFIMIITRYRHQEALIALSVSLFGFFGFALYPVCLELGVESTYPIAEATSTGLITISGQVQGIIIILLMQTFAPTENNDYQTCELKDRGIVAQDYTYPNIGFAATGVAMSMFFICCYKCAYNRLHAEQQRAAERILNFHSNRQYIIN